MRSAIIVFLVFSVSALVLLSSTETITLFSGSHHISDITSTSNDISCTSCHSHIQDELSSSQIHEDLECIDCHRLKMTASGELIDYAVHNDSGWYSGNQSHAAYTPTCLDCHGGNGAQVDTKFAPPAPAFNQTDYGSDYSAHKPFVEYASVSSSSSGENEACIACHTNYSVENEFTRPGYFDFSIKWDNGWYVDPNSRGPANTTTITELSSGAKHQFKARVECVSCHQDVWNAINNDEENEYGSTRASHVCWQWTGLDCDSTGCEKVKRGDPMHNISRIGADNEYGYDNITDYCMHSCHKPRINPSATTPPIFDSSVHAAYRISCYQCHNSTVYDDSVWSKPRTGWDTPDFGRDLTADTVNHSGHEEIDDEALSLPLFTQAETCISCKRGSCSSCHDDDCVIGNCEINYPHYRTWTEPNNTMYHYNDSRYI